MLQAAISHRRAKLSHPFIVRRTGIDGIDDLLLRMLLADVLKQPVGIIPGFHLIIADQPQISVASLVYPGYRQCQQKFKDMHQIRQSDHFQFFENFLFHTITN